jgi:hypothetical protein
VRGIRESRFNLGTGFLETQSRIGYAPPKLDALRDAVATPVPKLFLVQKPSQEGGNRHIASFGNAIRGDGVAKRLLLWKIDGGRGRARTGGLLVANEALSQLSYTPIGN